MNWIETADKYNVPLSFNLMMYEDGTVSQDSLNILYDVKNRSNSNPPPGYEIAVNDSDPAITYNGSWSVSSNRNVGDFNNDVHYTRVNNDFFKYEFTGTGIDYITEKYLDQGDVDIYIDDVFQETVSCYNSTRITQQAVFSIRGLISGNHTIKGIKKSGTFMLVDAFNVISTPSYFKIKNRTGGLVLNGGGGYDGYPVTEWSDVSSTNLQWQIIDAGNGYVKIKNRTDGLVLNGGGGYSGYPVTEWSDVNSTNLQWKIIDQGNGYVKIRNHTDGLFLSGGGSHNGNSVTEAQDSSGTDLEWQIIFIP